MNVLILTYFFPPDAEVGALRPYRFAKYLERLGFNIEVIAAGPNFRPATDGKLQRLRGDSFAYPSTLLEKLCRKVFGVHGWGLVWSHRAGRRATKSISSSGETVILSTSPPLAVHRAALIIKRTFPGIRWIADFRDPLTSSFDAEGMWAPQFGRLLERRILGATDLVIANTDLAAERWRERFPEYRSKFHVLWNGFDPEDPISASPLPDRPYRVLAHFGSLYKGRQPGRLLASLGRLIESGRLQSSTIRIRLVGSPRETLGCSLATIDKLGCVEIVDRVPRPEAQRLMATSDYLLLLDLEGQTDGLHVPAKVFEYLRIGRPILAYTCRNSALESVLERSGVSHACVYHTDADPQADEKLYEFLRLSSSPVEMTPSFQMDFSAPVQAARLANWLSPDFAIPQQSQDTVLFNPCRNSR